jgi:hypothetical protein
MSHAEMLLRHVGGKEIEVSLHANSNGVETILGLPVFWNLQKPEFEPPQCTHSRFRDNRKIHLRAGWFFFSTPHRTCFLNAPLFRSAFLTDRISDLCTQIRWLGCVGVVLVSANIGLRNSGK